MDESTVELIQAPRWERIATAAVYLLLGLFGVAMVFLSLIPGAAAPPLIVTGAILAVIGCVVGVRARRVAVTLSADRLQYFGFTTSCSIPKDAIAAVLDTATVEWRGPAGGTKSCALWLFRPAYEDDGTKFARYWRWRREGLLRVREWATGQGVEQADSRN